MKLALIGGLAAFLFLGLCAAMLCGAPLEKVLRRRWAATPCVIEEVRISDIYHGPTGKSQTGSSTGIKRLDVRYRHERGMGIHWMFGEKSDLAEKARSYPIGARMTCYVDPGDASRSVLRLPSLTVTDYGLLVFCLVLIPVLILAWMGVTIARERKTPGAGAAPGVQGL